jgi:hypothetical protein
MVVPVGGKPLRLAESAQSTERDSVLDIDRLAPPEAAADERRGLPTRSSTGEVDADRSRLVDQLQQRPATTRIRMNVMLQECAGKRPRDGREILDRPNRCR